MSMANPIRRVTFAMVLLLVSGPSLSCVGTETIACESGIRCPAGLVCAEGYAVCGRPDNVAACHQKAAGAACRYQQNLSGICEQGLCKPRLCESAGECEDGNPCTDDVCNQGRCESRANQASCDDGSFCNGLDTCVAGQCVSLGEPPCADALTCDEGAGTCIGCSEDEQCPKPTFTPWSECQPGGDTCTRDGQRSRSVLRWRCNTSNETCEVQLEPDEIELCPITTNGQACDDGNACTEIDQCAAGTCTGQSLDCGDDNPCTLDGCDLTQGCTYMNEPITTLCAAGSVPGNCDGRGTCVACPGVGEPCWTGDPTRQGRGYCDVSGNWQCIDVGPAPAGIEQSPPAAKATPSL